jgi:hypothetical protein
MTGLWTNDHDTLAETLRRGNVPNDWRTWDQLQPEEREPYLLMVEYAIDTGVVRVLDPDDTKLVQQMAATIRSHWDSGGTRWDGMARAVIVALRQP